MMDPPDTIVVVPRLFLVKMVVPGAKPVEDPYVIGLSRHRMYLIIVVKRDIVTALQQNR